MTDILYMWERDLREPREPDYERLLEERREREDERRMRQSEMNTLNFIKREATDQLKAEFDFDFNPCPYPRPDDFDGLLIPWGQSNYVNPPFAAGITAWARKAVEEHKKGKKIVFVYPIDKWIHWFIEQGAEIRNLKDVRWLAIEDGKPGKGTGRHIACFILDPQKRNGR